MFVHCNAKLINLGETEVSLSYFYALLVDFLLMGASRPQTPRCFQVYIIKLHQHLGLQFYVELALWHGDMPLDREEDFFPFKYVLFGVL